MHYYCVSKGFIIVSDEFIIVLKVRQNERKTKKERVNLREVLLQVSEHRLNLRAFFAVSCELLLQLSLPIHFTSFIETIVDTVVHVISFFIILVVWVFSTN